MMAMADGWRDAPIENDFIGHADAHEEPGCDPYPGALPDRKLHARCAGHPTFGFLILALLWQIFRRAGIFGIPAARFA